MRIALLTILALVVATALGLLSNIVATKIQPHIEHRTRLIYILFSVLLGISIVIAVAVSIPSTPDKPQISDNLTITSIKTLEDGQTHISQFGDQGVVSVRWEVILSNVGETNLSVTSYDVKQVGDAFPAVMYTGMNQGLFEFDPLGFKRRDLPLVIPAGESRKIFIQLGVLMTPESYKLVRDQFSNSSNATLGTISTYLNSKGTDFYGNKVEPLPKNTGFRFPSKDDVREQVFVASFDTARGTSIQEPLSFYRHGGIYDPRRR